MYEILTLALWAITWNINYKIIYCQFLFNLCQNYEVQLPILDVKIKLTNAAWK